MSNYCIVRAVFCDLNSFFITGIVLIQVTLLFFSDIFSKTNEYIRQAPFSITSLPRNQRKVAVIKPWVSALAVSLPWNWDPQKLFHFRSHNWNLYICLENDTVAVDFQSSNGLILKCFHFIEFWQVQRHSKLVWWGSILCFMLMTDMRKII